ncbi:MAG: hypothetical protein JNK67_24325 [Alphaproteobacteria bacterium]|nr:hypothetical protein [Alphaproteobacteria bacterium]
MSERGAPTAVAAIAIAIALALPAPIAAAQALDCPQKPPQITIEIVSPKPRIDRSRTREKLTRESAERPPGDVHTLGLYSALWSMTASREVASLVESGGRENRGCAWLDKVAIRVEARPRLIYLARELQPRTCRYAAVLAHERKHVAVDDAVLAEAAGALSARLADALADLRTPAPVRLTGLDELRRRFIDESESRINAMWQAITDERNRRQRDIDSPEEYARVEAECRR